MALKAQYVISATKDKSMVMWGSSTASWVKKSKQTNTTADENRVAG